MSKKINMRQHTSQTIYAIWIKNYHQTGYQPSNTTENVKSLFVILKKKK